MRRTDRALTIRSLCNIVMPFGSYRASYVVVSDSASERTDPNKRARDKELAGARDCGSSGIELIWRTVLNAVRGTASKKKVLAGRAKCKHFWPYSNGALLDPCWAHEKRAHRFARAYFRDASPEESLCGRAACVAPSNHREPAKHLTISKTDLRSNMCFITEIQSRAIVFSSWILRSTNSCLIFVLTA